MKSWIAVTLLKGHRKVILLTVSLLAVLLGAALVYSFYSKETSSADPSIPKESENRRIDRRIEGPDPSHLTKWDQQYEDTSLDFHNSLNTKEKIEIYLAVLGKGNKMLVRDSLFNSAGTMYTAPEDRKSRKNKMFYISIEKEVKQAIEKFWIRKHLNNKFVSNLRDYAIIYDNRITEFKDHYSSVKLGPIKNIKGEIIAGFETYTDPLTSLACKYLLKKKNGKWIVVDTWGPHAIS